MFRLLESGASLGRAEDEVMPAGEKPRHTQEAPSPMEMLVWRECLDSGAESHARATVWRVKSDGKSTIHFPIARHFDNEWVPLWVAVVIRIDKQLSQHKIVIVVKLTRFRAAAVRELFVLTK